MTDSRDIKDLHPTLRRGAVELKMRMEEVGYNMGISSTYRCNDYQNYLYAQGRTRAGSIVTNAKAGESMHNYRLAFDIFCNIKGKEYSELKFFSTAGRIWQEMGGEWGGTWTTFVDQCHFEYTGGLTLKDLQQGKTLPQDAKMKWEQATKIEEKGEEEMRYNKLSDLPDWALPTIEKLIKQGVLKGNANEEINLDLSLDMVRLLVLNDRANLYP